MVSYTSILFWSYLWGIETWSICSRNRRGKAFWSYLWGIETGYVDMWITNIPQFWSYLWGIETGYSSCWFGCSPLVLIVPMRNWNNSISNSTFTLSPFWSYLWGIETLYALSGRCTCQPQVLIVPMRNWNSRSCSNRLISCWGFDRTYEELKQALRFSTSAPGERVLIVDQVQICV